MVAVFLGVRLRMKPGGPQSSTVYVPLHSTAWELGVHTCLWPTIIVFSPKQAKLVVIGPGNRGE